MLKIHKLKLKNLKIYKKLIFNQYLMIFTMPNSEIFKTTVNKKDYL